MRIADRLVPVASRWAKNRSRSLNRGADLWRARAAGREKYLSNTVVSPMSPESSLPKVPTLRPMRVRESFLPHRIPTACWGALDGRVDKVSSGVFNCLVDRRFRNKCF
jgi:hypothetical protein